LTVQRRFRAFPLRGVDRLSVDPHMQTVGVVHDGLAGELELLRILGAFEARLAD